MTDRQQGDSHLAAEQQYEGVEKHPLLIWTSLSPGDVVSLQGLDTSCCVGTVESRSSDGLTIWIKDDLNERKLFHFHECRSVLLMRKLAARPIAGEP